MQIRPNRLLIGRLGSNWELAEGLPILNPTFPSKRQLGNTS